jgi:5-formyltetrahydrofolate cyclo-ligase
METAMPPKNKQELRRKFLRIRRAAAPAQRENWNRRIAELFAGWPIYQQCRSVLFYIAMPEEAATAELIEDALRRGKQVYAPLLGNKYGEMSAAVIKRSQDLIAGKYGLMMPPPDSATLAAGESIDLIVVPGVAFDRTGNRLGMGAGYYDRFFSRTNHSVRLGLAWDCQVVASVPCESHDIRMQYLLTEAGLIACG